MSICTAVFRARDFEGILPEVRTIARKHRKPYEAYINECVRYLKISRTEAKQRLAYIVSTCDCTQYIEIHRLFKYRATYMEFIAVLRAKNTELIGIFMQYGYPTYYPNTEAKELMLRLIKGLEPSEQTMNLWEKAQSLEVGSSSD